MSEHLYRKPAKTLTLPEAALVAGLVRAPSTLSPWSNYEGALERSHLVLSQMRAQGFITRQQEDAARRVHPRIQPYRQPGDAKAAWAKDFLRQQFRNEFGGDHPPDWQVHTSFLPSIQGAPQPTGTAGLHPPHQPGLEAALASPEPQTRGAPGKARGGHFAQATFHSSLRSRAQPAS